MADAFFVRNSKDVRTVVTKGSVACGAEACTNFWVCSCSVLTRVDGMNSLWGVVKMQRASNPCTAFESIDLHGLKASAPGIATYALARSKLKTILMDPDWLLWGTQIFDGGAGWGAPTSLVEARGLNEFKNSLPLEVAAQPIGHVGIVDGPRIFLVFAFLPVTFVTIEELVPVALVLDYGVAFATVLVPVVVLLSIPVPFLRSVDDHGGTFRLCAHLRDEHDLADGVQDADYYRTC